MTSIVVRECGSPSQVDPAGWDALVARSPASLAGSRAWIRASFRASHREASPLILTAESDGQLFALLPLAVHRSRAGSTVRFAGAPHNDLNDVMVVPGREIEGATALLPALAGMADRGWSVDLRCLDPGGALARADLEQGMLDWLPDEPAPVVELRGRWRSVASGRRRRQWDRQLRGLSGRHAVEFRRIEGDRVLAELREFIRLHEARRRAAGRPPDQPPMALIEAAVAELAPQRKCVFMDMLVDGRPAARDLYLLDGDDVAMMWLRGLDPAWRQYPCGHLLLRQTAEAFKQRGYLSLDLGRGAESYKFFFGAEHRVLLRAQRSTPG